VDDTTLVNKIITQEIANNIADVIYHKYGNSLQLFGSLEN
jgi:hypothetical protein